MLEWTPNPTVDRLNLCPTTVARKRTVIRPVGPRPWKARSGHQGTRKTVEGRGGQPQAWLRQDVFRTKHVLARGRRRHSIDDGDNSPSFYKEEVHGDRNAAIGVDSLY